MAPEIERRWSFLSDKHTAKSIPHCTGSDDAHIPMNIDTPSRAGGCTLPQQGMCRKTAETT